MSVYVIMDYPQFTLDELIRTRAGVIQEKAMAYIIREILTALKSIHLAEQVHRDVRPDNIFLGLAGQVVLGDFGYIHQAK
jgi:serine/threonine protein kinase